MAFYAPKFVRFHTLFFLREKVPIFKLFLATFPQHWKHLGRVSLLHNFMMAHATFFLCWWHRSGGEKSRSVAVWLKMWLIRSVGDGENGGNLSSKQTLTLDTHTQQKKYNAKYFTTFIRRLCRQLFYVLHWYIYFVFSLSFNYHHFYPCVLSSPFHILTRFESMVIKKEENR